MDCCVWCATIVCTYGIDTDNNVEYFHISVKIISLLELKDQNGDDHT